MSINHAWLELIDALRQLASGDPREAGKRQPIASWYERYHHVRGSGCVVVEPKHATNRVAEQLRRYPDHAMFLYRDEATCASLEQSLIEAWPATLRTAMLVDGSMDPPRPTHLLYRDAVAAFMVEHAPRLQWRRVPANAQMDPQP